MRHIVWSCCFEDFGRFEKKQMPRQAFPMFLKEMIPLRLERPVADREHVVKCIGTAVDGETKQIWRRCQCIHNNEWYFFLFRSTYLFKSYNYRVRYKLPMVSHGLGIENIWCGTDVSVSCCWMARGFGASEYILPWPDQWRLPTMPSATPLVSPAKFCIHVLMRVRATHSRIHLIIFNTLRFNKISIA